MILTKNQLKSLINEHLTQGNLGAIYCDMDGVLVDFVSGAITLLNAALAGQRPDLVKSSKSARRALRKLHAELGPQWRAMTSNDLKLKPVRNLMYPIVGRRAGEFFLNLSPLEDGIGLLWPYINSLGMPVNILSAPIEAREGITAKEGKEQWARDKKYLKPKPLEVIIVPAVEKQNYAVTNGMANILIDDKPSTIEQWNTAGGVGILHYPGNSQRTIEQLSVITGAQ